MNRRSLQPLYDNAIYRVRLGVRSLRLELHRDNTQLQDHLPQPDACWALIGAVNPLSRTYPAPLNARRHRHFERLLARRGLRFAQGEGSAADGSWFEPALWIAPIALAQARMYGHRYAQAAILYGKGAQRARLVWLAR